MPSRSKQRIIYSLKLGFVGVAGLASLQVIMAQQAPANARSYGTMASSIVYGSHPRQQVDIYAPEDAVDDLPVVLFVHGGGWSMGNKERVQAKPMHFTASNYIFASTGYRLVPTVSVEQQAKDVGEAVKALVGQANSIGVDPTRIVLMGHSAGAHLAALVATDPHFAGDAFDAIQGVILLDGAGYDVAQRIDAAPPLAWHIFNTAFGSDPKRHASLSPLTHVGGKDTPNWLALYVKERRIARLQSERLIKALTAQGKAASALPISETDHGRLNKEIGTASGEAQTKAIDGFLANVFSQGEEEGEGD